MWAFSSAKLETRGKRMEKLARKQTSNRKTAKGVGMTITKKKRGGKMTKHRKEGSCTYTVAGYTGNKCLAMLGRATFREERLMNDECAHRRREQLFKLGKMDIKPKVKKDLLSVPERWSGLVPSGIPFTVVGLLAAMCSGKIKPLYSIDGKCQAL